MVGLAEQRSFSIIGARKKDCDIKLYWCFFSLSKAEITLVGSLDLKSWAIKDNSRWYISKTVKYHKYSNIPKAYLFKDKCFERTYPIESF